MLSELAQESCVRPGRDESPLSEVQVGQLHAQVPDWEIKEADGIKRLERKFKFKNFLEALAFTNKVGESAEAQDHHPALLTEWGAVTVWWWTHVVKGLHRNDFIMAARTDKLFPQM